MERKYSGSVEAFNRDWVRLEENNRYHFKRGEPANQIQFAFQSHWHVFLKLLDKIRSGRVLEVGSGRGSMSAFFADVGFEVFLLDISETALRIAKANFKADGLNGHYVCGDALLLPYHLETFDVVLSIGLLEHFAQIEQPLSEQIRILRPGGLFLGYVVPKRFVFIQALATPINFLLNYVHTVYYNMKSNNRHQANFNKVPLFRNDYRASDYLSVLYRLGVKEAGSFGMFPVPLISHSPEFPFTPMAPSLEQALVRLWKLLLTPHLRKSRDPWKCPENWGLAFLLWAKR